MKTDEWCTSSSTLVFLGDSDTETGLYRVSGDGTVLESKSSDTSSVVSTMDIIELTKSSIKLQSVDATATTEIEMTKN